jgi:hypothetical protein
MPSAQVETGDYAQETLNGEDCADCGASRKLVRELLYNRMPL